MPARMKLEGQKFDRLLVLSFAGMTEGLKRSLWNCVCDCGTELKVRGIDLAYGRKPSCGCKRREAVSKQMRTHGRSKTPEWSVWMSIKARCKLPTCVGYKHYGGRGISICKRWDEAFENFYSDMGPRPSKRHSIERIDVNGNYEPGNCKWGTWAEQVSNKRNTYFVQYSGERVALRKLYEMSSKSVSYVKFRDRVRIGWDIDDALQVTKSDLELAGSGGLR